MQEVGEALRVYPLLTQCLEVVLGTGLLLLELRYAPLHARRYDPLLDGVEDVLQPALGGRERFLGLPAACPHLRAVGTLGDHAGYPHGLRALGEQLAERTDYRALELLAADVPHAPARAAVVLVLDVAAPAPAHALEVAPAPGAYRPPGEREVAPVLGRALLHAPHPLCPHERGLVDDLRHTALPHDSAPLVAPRVAPVVEHLVDHRVPARVTGPRPHPALREVGGYGVSGLAVYLALEGLPHERRLVRVDLVLVVLVAPVAEDAHAVGLAAQGVALHAAPRAYRRLLGLAGGEALEQLLVDDALRAVRYRLEGRDELHAVLGELALVYGRVVLPARETVHHVDQDDVRLARVGDHALELRAVVRAARYGVVAVLGGYCVALAPAPVAADTQLVVYRGLALLAARKPGIYHGCFWHNGYDFLGLHVHVDTGEPDSPRRL